LAGILLSIGMAVDANVVIFERIKEAYASGKTLTAAVKSGFSRAVITVIDANVTTLIAAIVLWIVSPGSVKGFAITLFIGVLLSMVTAVLVTRWLIKLIRPLVSKEKEAKFFKLKRGVEADV
ncbi:MAG: MMPL family transporter, partial [Clostridia bacterium]|nr:MMPL family transporter [Clostridia bacterium]